MKVIINITIFCAFSDLCLSDIAFNHLKSHNIISMDKLYKHWNVYTKLLISKAILNEKMVNINLLAFFNRFQIAKKFVIFANRLHTDVHF